MKRALFLLLALSLGLNVGMLYVKMAGSPEGPGLLPGPPPGDRPSDRPGDRPNDRRGEGPGGRPDDRQGQPPSTEIIIDDHLARMTPHLDLSPEQQLAIRKILESKMPLMSDLRRGSDEANAHISEAFAAADFDVDQFNLLVHQASLSRGRADSLSAVMLLEEAAVLTAEQRVKYAAVAPTVYTNPRGQNAPPPRRR